jgi:hypothetical protein
MIKTREEESMMNIVDSCILAVVSVVVERRQKEGNENSMSQRVFSTTMITK